MSRSLSITATENTLTVYDVTSSDVGVYTCTATNILGSDTSNNGTYICMPTKGTVLIIPFCSRLFDWHGLSVVWLPNNVIFLEALATVLM